MDESAKWRVPKRIAIAFAVVAVVGAGIWWFFECRGTWTRSDALVTALCSVVKGQDHDQSLVARIILDNFRETRADASRWSGIYWGSTFFAAVFSALAALVLKVETIIKNEGAKKDLAALLSVCAALLVTISTSGDFQRKWQANRIAAAELEHTGYQFLEHDGVGARTYLASVGEILLRRQLSIAGGTERRKEAPPDPAAKPE